MPQPSPLPRVSLLHATRGRPLQARECRRKWLQAAAKPDRVEHIFAVDADDLDSINQLADLSPLVVERQGGGCVAAWNLAASASTGEVLVQLSDDWSPLPNWDEEFVKRFRDVSQPGVLRVSDGHRSDDLLCMAICTRSWVKLQGELLHSGYVSLYSDDEFSYRAYQQGVVIDARDIVLMHYHPNYDPSIPMDDTYCRQNSLERKQKGHDLFVKRNPTADAHWIHEDIWERHFVAVSPSGRDDHAVRIGLKEECARLRQNLAQLTAEHTALAAELAAEHDKLRGENDRLAMELRCVLESAEGWQRRSWLKRAFHRWHPPGAAVEQATFLQRLNRSLRKRLGAHDSGNSGKR